MEVLNNIFSFFTDHSKRFYIKFSVGLGILFFLFMADDILGFTYFNNIQRKIEQTKAISEILKDSTLTRDTKVKLIEIQQDLLNRESLVTHLSNLVKFEPWNTPDTVFINSKGVIIHRHYSITSKNQNWHILSSGGLFLIFGFVMTFSVLFNSDSEHLSMIGSSGAIFITWVLMIASCAFFTYLLGFIPRMGETWVFNYLLNAAIQILSIIAVGYLMKRQDDKIMSGYYDERNKKRANKLNNIPDFKDINE